MPSIVNRSPFYKLERFFCCSVYASPRLQKIQKKGTSLGKASCFLPETHFLPVFLMLFAWRGRAFQWELDGCVSDKIWIAVSQERAHDFVTSTYPWFRAPWPWVTEVKMAEPADCLTWDLLLACPPQTCYLGKLETTTATFLFGEACLCPPFG